MLFGTLRHANTNMKTGPKCLKSKAEIKIDPCTKDFGVRYTESHPCSSTQHFTSNKALC